MATYPPAPTPGAPGQPAPTGSAKPDDGKQYQDTREPRKPGDQSLVPEQYRGKSPTELAQRWEKELQAAKKELLKFHTTGRKLVQRYLDERESAAFDQSDSKFNLFWSNIEVLKSSLYAKPPNVDVSNTHKDSEDDVSRVAANILQRLLNNDCEDDDESTYPDITRQAVSDYLIVGLGQVWYRYEVETEESEVPATTDPQTGQVLSEAVPYEAITSEDAPADYIYWEDFWWSPARVWQDVRWVARRVYMNREELIARFGDAIGKDIPVSKQRSKGDALGQINDPWEKAGVFEIWDKTTECAYWHVLGYNVICDYKEDPLKLKGFFPCPQPLIANLTTSKVMPRGDYLLAQDQYQQIDELTTRIKYLTRACKVVGVYDKNSTPIGRVFQEGMENQMIPVDNWAAFAEKGGLKGQMDWVPLEVIALVIEKLTAQRDTIKQALYEVLGIGDIMRGMTNPDETLGAQQLKAQFGGNRLQFKQQQIGAWVAGGQRIRAQIICDRFQPQTIIDRSNIMHSPDAAGAQAAVAFLKQGGDSKFYRISVESETMAMVDWAQERDSRTQFMQAVGTFVQSVTPLIQSSPEAAPVVMQLMKWGLGGFRISKEIQTVLDQAVAAASQPPKPPTPTPAQQVEMDKTKSESIKNKTQAVENLAKAATHHHSILMNQQAGSIMGPGEPPQGGGPPPGAGGPPPQGGPPQGPPPGAGGPPPGMPIQ
jgi:hypothetical protein